MNTLETISTGALVTELERRGGRVIFGERAFGLTSKQRAVFEFVRERIVASDGVPPTYAEIAEHIGLRSRSRIAGIVDALIERGALRKIPHKSRSLAVVVGAIREPRK